MLSCSRTALVPFQELPLCRRKPSARSTPAARCALRSLRSLQCLRRRGSSSEPRPFSPPGALYSQSRFVHDSVGRSGPDMPSNARSVHILVEWTVTGWIFAWPAIRRVKSQSTAGLGLQRVTLNSPTGILPVALEWANSSVRLSARLITGRSAVQIRVGPSLFLHFISLQGIVDRVAHIRENRR